MNYRASRKLGKVLMAASALSLVTGLYTDQLVFPLMTLGLLVADYLQTRAFYRCPDCRERLDMRQAPPEYCPACGNKL